MRKKVTSFSSLKKLKSSFLNYEILPDLYRVSDLTETLDNLVKFKHSIDITTMKSRLQTNFAFRFDKALSFQI